MYRWTLGDKQLPDSKWILFLLIIFGIEVVEKSGTTMF